jgi:class 3 adenylate cyclase
MRCPRCQVTSPEGAKFCLNCGTPLEAPRPVEGERKFVTALFADVVDSTALAEQFDPEEWVEIMNGAYEYLIAPVYRY